MKVEIFGKHWGLVSHLRDIFEIDNEVSIVDAIPFPAQFGLKQETWKPDVHISTFPYDDIKTYDKSVPLILYATDPVYEWVYKEVVEIQKWPGCTVVAAEPCYSQTYWPINYQHEIPFAINPEKYSEWHGGLNRVAVVNRKARERWTECVRGATGIAYTLEQFLGDIPFDVVAVQDNTEYRELLSSYDVMFYFSNSPYTLVMFEGMGIGMPMVGFNHTHDSTYKPIEKYLNTFETNMEEIRKMLRDKLAKPKKELYPLKSFDMIRKDWGLVIKKAIETHRTA